MNITEIGYEGVKKQMRTYEIPRNYKGEGRILYVFSTKALIYTIVGMGIGLIFYFILNSLGMQFVGILVDVILRCYWFFDWNV